MIEELTRVINMVRDMNKRIDGIEQKQHGIESWVVEFDRRHNVIMQRLSDIDGVRSQPIWAETGKVRMPSPLPWQDESIIPEYV